MNYWLMKTEPGTFSWQDLLDMPGQREHWDGIRNYQARNFMRDMKNGDLVFIYHSVVKPQVITGLAKIVKEFYPDFTQFDAAGKYYDPSSDPEDPRWGMVDVQAIETIDPPITRDELKVIPELADMVLFTNTRLSVQPVKKEEWDLIMKLR